MVTTGAEPIFVDTNVLTRATIDLAPLHRDAQAALLQFRREGRELWISNQIIREYISNASRPQSYSPPIPMPQILDEVRHFRSTFHVAAEDAKVMDQLVQLLDKIPVGGKQIHDANIVAVMLVNGINALFTYNRVDFERFSSYITVTTV